MSPQKCSQICPQICPRKRPRTNRRTAAALAAIALAAAALLTLGSCVGVDAAVTFRRDGSGVLALEYRAARTLQSLGAQDGNERWLPLPVGRADFERSLARMPGLRLRSHSSKEEGADLVTRVTIDFDSPEALTGFLDAASGRAVFDRPGGASRLTLTLPALPAVNPDLRALLTQAAAGYDARVAVTFPAEGVLDAPAVDGASVVPSGKTASFTTPLAALLAAGTDVTLAFTWR